MTTSKANITFFMCSAWRALWLAYTDPQSTVPLVALRIMNAKTTCCKTIFIFLFAYTKGFCFSHIKRRKIFVWACDNRLLSWIYPNKLTVSHWEYFMLLCIIDIAYHSTWARIESGFGKWMHPFIFIAQKISSWFFHAVNSGTFNCYILPDC